MLLQISKSPRFDKKLRSKIWPEMMMDEDNHEPDFPLHLISRSMLLDTISRNSDIKTIKKKPTIDDFEYFHKAIGPIIEIANIFGIFPIYGSRSPSPSMLSFKMRSFKSYYAIAVCVILGIFSFISIVHMMTVLQSSVLSLQEGISAATAGAVFYSDSFIGAVIFYFLSPKWTKLQQEWRLMEQQLDSYKENNSTCPPLRRKFTIITFIVLFFAIIEHIMSLIVNCTQIDGQSSSSNMTFERYIEAYTVKSHGFIISIDYSLGLGIVCFIASKFATFIWNFTDLFLILVSTGIAERYKYLNKNVLSSIENKKFDFNWLDLREKYAMLSSLVKEVDSVLAPVIVLSFFNNLYFICLQLLNGLSSNEKTAFDILYLFGSFIFLVGRTVAVTLSAARIYDQSRMVLPAIFNCPASSYNIETERLQHQLSTDEIALTGMKFFSITRNFMLAVAGAIVTYEVVLLQFNASMKS
ncbi:hypothetical protein HCN44_008099 [Aphidius gifuensis]|uniref:Gustatory receptor n=1 Tax=Aphidius gifuensis TaxID=684658 RepID=A0A834XQ33_APHGI|nr:hypothetical protein HCN44_008099 [Aphidius gifuensis]